MFFLCVLLLLHGKLFLYGRLNELLIGIFARHHPDANEPSGDLKSHRALDSIAYQRNFQLSTRVLLWIFGDSRGRKKFSKAKN